jgi:hypothetical protein
MFFGWDIIKSPRSRTYGAQRHFSRSKDKDQADFYFAQVWYCSQKVKPVAWDWPEF